ncbi:MAG: isopeptide-forming domain-containing fimbrial protein [Clostridia bacterium]|nr:isopeptide-forming domain-containing fimbrial protein [Clostridia bacterium]
MNFPDEQARAFVYAVMSDYADFFKQHAGSTDFNIGADEVAFTSWDGTKIYAVGWDTFASSNGIGSTAYDTFIWFVNNVYDLLAGKGYNVRAYNDFLERGDQNYTQQLNKNIEIVYWNSDNPSYPPNNSAGYNMKPAAEFIKDGRTVYTGIATYCYYVLRKEKDAQGNLNMQDARDPAFNNFQFNKATAENIWTYWEPTLVTVADACTQTNWVVTIDTSPQIHLSADQVEGAYYMFWGDEAGISTEEEIWNGVDANGKWNIRERMWANINKMWKINADGSSLSHDSVQTLRTAVGDFPGLTTCSAETVLPAAQTLALAPPPAEPSGNGSISISNAIDGQVYSAYRILDLESYDKTTGIYRYKVSERWASFFESGAPGLNYMTVSEGGSVSWNSGADPAAFAKAAKAFADANGIPPNAVAEATGTPAQAYIGNVPLGYYLVDTSIGSLCSLDTTDDDAVVSEKNTEPEIDKKLKDKAEDEYTDNANSASIGDTVYYQLEITVGKGAINYVVEDTFDNGLTFDAEQSVEVVGATAGTDYTLTVDGQTFKIEFNNDYLETKAENSDIVIHYQATVNKDALIRTANQNKVMLRWGNGTRYAEDLVETFVYDFSYTKVDGAGNPLNGAEFTLYDAETGGNKIPVAYVGTREIDGTVYKVYRKALAGEGVDMNGTHVIVEGFDAEDSGKLYLHETESPEGYNILTGRVAVNLSTENRSDKVIENRSGQELPSTGGFGTAAFIFVVSLLLLAEMVLFSTEKKMSVR